MKDYVGANERILEKWCQEYISRGKDVDLTPDGIMYRGDLVNINGKWIHNTSENGTIENNLWAHAPIRILYLTKDQNAGGEYWDLRIDTYHLPNSEKEEYLMDRTTAFNRNIARSLYGLHELLFNGRFVRFDDIDEHEVVKVTDSFPFARINCKKEAGGPKCNDSTLKKYIREDYDLLEEQILNLDADVFVCCARGIIMENLNHIFKNNFVQLSNYIWYNEVDKKLAIDTYHPGNMGSAKETYEDCIMIPCYEFLKSHQDFSPRR